MNSADALVTTNIATPTANLYVSSIRVRELGLQAYEPVWKEMQDFARQRTPDTDDEIWLLEHYPVYTLGLNGKHEHLLNTGQIPVIHCDRGGQATYHAPGQMVMYPLIDLNRRHLGIRQLVTLLEQAMIAVLAGFSISAEAKADAPGVYVEGRKIGAIGLRIKNHSSYHGISLNNNLDLAGFNGINPCGFRNLPVTRLVDFGIEIDTMELGHLVTQAFLAKLGS